MTRWNRPAALTLGITLPPLFLSTLYLYSRLRPSPSTTAPLTVRYLVSREGTTTLPSSKTVIQWAEYGPESGPVILYFHGIPGGKIIPISSLRQVCEEKGVRIILMERGTEMLELDMAMWASEVKEYLDMRNITEEIAIGAFGEGVPYALSLLSSLPPNSISALNVSGVYLFSSIGFYSPQNSLVDMHAIAKYQHFLARWLPNFALRSYYNLNSPAIDPSKYVDYVYSAIPISEQRKLPTDWRMTFNANVIEQFKSGTDTYSSEVGRVYGAAAPSGWGFDVRAAGSKGVPIFFFHGEADHISPFQNAEHLCALLRSAGADCHLHKIPDGAGRWTALDLGLKHAIQMVKETGKAARPITPDASRARAISIMQRANSIPNSPVRANSQLRTGYSPASHFTPTGSPGSSGRNSPVHDKKL